MLLLREALFKNIPCWGREIVRNSWSNAATVILLGKLPENYRNTGNGYLSKPAPTADHMGDTSGLTSRASKHQNWLSKLSTFDYKVLMLQRSKKSKFMSSAYVFPGGMLSESDFSKEWEIVYANAGWNWDEMIHFADQCQQISPRPPMLTSNTQSGIHSEIAVRICGIRELFEESGILLWKSKSNESLQKLNRLTLEVWREKVNKDDSVFVQMCKELSVAPDVWALHEWNNWLTPTGMPEIHGKRRFDTMFYVCCMNTVPEMVHDDVEVVSSKWLSPADVLLGYSRGLYWLPPPQLYELSRLCHFTNLDKVSRFASVRAKQGCVRWLPIRIICHDGVVSVLPGDDLYPEEPELEESGTVLSVDKSVDEVFHTSSQLHRFEFTEQGKSVNMFDAVIRVNIPASHGHLNPCTS